VKRYAVCKVIGDGATPETAYRAAAQDLAGISHSALIASNADGTPRFSWCLVLLSAADLTQASSSADVDLFPAISLDALISSLTAAQRNAISTKLQARGIDPSVFANAGTFRGAIRALGRLHHVSFNENGLDVP
jgi:hypothetical protein